MPRIPVQVAWDPEVLVGTMHAPGPAACAGERVGVLLLNAGAAPRAGNSDLAVHIGERVADLGWPCFRFDLPGLGDSTGRSWPDIASFWGAMQQGGHDAAVAALIRAVCEEHGLDGLVVGGLCAGAIASIRSAALDDGRVRGLLLLEPNFRASANTHPASAAAEGAEAASASPGDPDGPQPNGPQPNSPQPNSPQPNIAQSKGAQPHAATRRLARLWDLDELLQFLLGRSRYARPFAPLRPWLERWAIRRLGTALPRDVLLHEVLSWTRMFERGVPSLVINARGLISDHYVGRIIRTLPGSAEALLRRVRIPGTNHILTAGDARHRVLAAIEEWLRAPVAAG